MDNVELTLTKSRMQSVCDEMGASLRRSAFSPNIKDRLDFSCAVFDAAGELCAQAAHIPVHLGSMAYAMRDVVARMDWAPGDMVMFNDPFLGGTHLPDVTVIAPLFLGERLTAFVANRAHHADIGCAQPGSMPLSRSIADEGLVIAPTRLLRHGQPDPEVWAWLTAALRNPASTRGDFQAQCSANHVGLKRLAALAETLAANDQDLAGAMRAINAYAERLARQAVAALPDGRYEFRDCLDDDGAGTHDIVIAVALDIEGETITLDFAGTSDQVPGNVNCPLSVTAAAVFYALYCLMPPGTPACAGSLRPVKLRATPGSLLNARHPAAVAAGNVETSQRIVDVVFGALAAALPGRIPAASCGSMNNVAMGGEGWDYYETIGGGGGAHAAGAGLDAMHTHMTNTLNTPIEVLEMNYPVRISRYAVRRGSGGTGRHRGGAGVIREFVFQESTRLTLLTERRHHAPWGLAGGGGGAPGRNLLNGREIAPKVALELEPGDVLTVETPGGGGYGA